jgi:hypothetical protein
LIYSSFTPREDGKPIPKRSFNDLYSFWILPALTKIPRCSLCSVMQLPGGPPRVYPFPCYLAFYLVINPPPFPNHYSQAVSQQVVSSSLPSAPEPSPCTLPSQSPYSSTEVGGRHKTHSCHAGCWMSTQISWCLHGLYQRIGLGGLRVVAGREVCLPVKRVRLVSCNNREAEKKGKCRNT